MAAFKFLRSTLGFMQQKQRPILRSMSGKVECIPANAMVILAPGVEDIEAIIVIDVLRRIGVDVTIAGLNGMEPVKSMNGLEIIPDKSLKEIEEQEFHAVILPGGVGGTKAIGESDLAGEILSKQENCCRIIAAICAAPMALNKHGICYGKKLTSYPTMKDQLKINYLYKDSQNVCVDDYLITSRGPGTTFEWAIKLAEMLKGKEIAKKVALDMLYPANL